MKRLAGLLLHMAVILFTSGPVFAAYNVTISGDSSANGSWSGTSPAVWTPSGAGANVSVTEIQAQLNAGTNVNISTAGAGSDAGNISVNAVTSWSVGTLTLTAHNDININAVMSASNQAGLAMNYGWNGNPTSPIYGSQGGVKVGFAPGEGNGFLGRVDFPGRSGVGFLTINAAGYTVINSLGLPGSTTGTDLQGINDTIVNPAGNLAGKYALGVDINASETLGWIGDAGFMPIGDSFANSFTGIFDGLGHTINDLVIVRPGRKNVGLFGYGVNSVIRNLGMIGGNVTGDEYVGGLIGYTDNTVNNSYYNGIVSGNLNVAGLAGGNGGLISNSYAIGSVNGVYSVGGLVGTNIGTTSNSYAKVSVDCNDEAGGLVGINFGTINNSYATGSVNGNVDSGGLAGSSLLGQISNSYSTGTVVGTSGVGGLVGDGNDSVSNSFWNTDTSGQTISAGGSGIISSAMKLLATFANAGWDISSSDNSNSVWRITDGQSYPLLRTFVPPPATGTSNAATSITTTTATLNGTVKATYADASISFEYGPTVAYGTNVAATPATVVVGSGNIAASAAISGLIPGQTYHYRVKTTGIAGIGYGNDAVFTTQQLTQAISGFSPPANATYGNTITLSASASSGLTVVFSVTDGPGSISGNQLTITGVGTISLQASQPGNLNYSAAQNVAASIVVAKATATVTLGSLNQTYSGTAKAATATTNPAGKTMTFTYNGSETAPTNAGTYAVVATINDPNYTGSASGALIIAKATPTIDWVTPVDIYQGTALSATQLNATSSISGSFAYTPAAGQILPVDNNDLTVVFTPADTSNYNNASATVVINVRYKLDPIITWATPAAMTYGTALSATQLNASANIPGSLVYTSAPATVVTVGSILNAGAHSLTATFTPNDTVIYNNATRVVTLTINKAAASVSVGSQTRSYTGSALPATIATTPVGLNTSVTYNGNATAPTVAGTYAVDAAINDPNYSGSASGTLTITKAIATVTLGNLSQPYDGAQKAATASTTPVGLAVTITYDGSEIVPTEIGSYAVVATISDNNYQGSSTATLVIIPPSLTVAIAGTGTGTVTSSPAGISCNKSSAADVTCTNNSYDTVNLYATPSVLSLFKGWGGACGGLGACSVTISAGQTVTITATFNAASLLHIDGTTYPTLQAAYDAAADGSFIQLLDNTVAGTLDANRNVTVKLKGGYDAGYLNNPGTTALTAPLTVRQGAVVVDRIVIK